MATLTAATSIKDDFLPGINEPTEVWAGGMSDTDAADEEYRRDARYIIDGARAMLSERTITKKEFNETIVQCRDREYVRELAARIRESQRLAGYMKTWAKEVNLTEEDVNEAIEEAKQEERERNGW